MSFPNIKDFGRTAEQLEDKYDARGGCHPDYPVSTWVHAVNLDETLLGYWEFVYYKIVDEEISLAADSPYN